MTSPKHCEGDFLRRLVTTDIENAVMMYQLPARRLCSLYSIDRTRYNDDVAGVKESSRLLLTSKRELPRKTTYFSFSLCHDGTRGSPISEVPTFFFYFSSGGYLSHPRSHKLCSYTLPWYFNRPLEIGTPAPVTSQFPEFTLCSL
jgi:hypothetical protein